MVPRGGQESLQEINATFLRPEEIPDCINVMLNAVTTLLSALPKWVCGPQTVNIGRARVRVRFVPRLTAHCRACDKSNVEMCRVAEDLRH
jgi:hypothetical protein